MSLAPSVHVDGSRWINGWPNETLLTFRNKFLRELGNKCYYLLIKQDGNYSNFQTTKQLIKDISTILPFCWDNMGAMRADNNTKTVRDRDQDLDICMATLVPKLVLTITENDDMPNLEDDD